MSIPDPLNDGEASWNGGAAGHGICQSRCFSTLSVTAVDGWQVPVLWKQRREVSASLPVVFSASTSRWRSGAGAVSGPVRCWYLQIQQESSC